MITVSEQAQFECVVSDVEHVGLYDTQPYERHFTIVGNVATRAALREIRHIPGVVEALRQSSVYPAVRSPRSE